MCNMMVYCTQHMEDLIPASVVVTVELSNSLYLATSMTRVSSMSSFTGIMLIDAIQVLLSSFELSADMAQVCNQNTKSSAKSSSSPNVLFGIVNQVVTAAADAAIMVKSFRIRLRSGIEHKLSAEATQRLERMDRSGRFALSTFARQSSLIQVHAPRS